MPDLSRDKIDEMFEKYQNGYFIWELVKEYGFSEKMTENVLKYRKEGYFYCDISRPGRGRKVSPQEIEKMIELKRRGMTNWKISIITQRTERTVSQCLRKSMPDYEGFYTKIIPEEHKNTIMKLASALTPIVDICKQLGYSDQGIRKVIRRTDPTLYEKFYHQETIPLELARIRLRKAKLSMKTKDIHDQQYEQKVQQARETLDEIGYTHEHACKIFLFEDDLKELSNVRHVKEVQEKYAEIKDNMMLLRTKLSKLNKVRGPKKIVAGAIYITCKGTITQETIANWLGIADITLRQTLKAAQVIVISHQTNFKQFSRNQLREICRRKDIEINNYLKKPGLIKRIKDSL